jgi:type 1 glutamine amidotransferase
MIGIGVSTATVVAQQPATPNPNALRVYIRASLYTHHDYPQFLADWSKVLTERGAVVDGAYHFPTPGELDDVDVMILYAGDAGYMTNQERATLDAFVKRGGGIVSFHDSLCGPDPAHMASIVGGGKKHGEQNSARGDLQYTIVDRAHPIMQGMSDFALADEAFMKMTWVPSGIHVLATAPVPRGEHQGEVVPQIWTYEHTVTAGQPARAFVWMQGHVVANFADPRIQPMLMRGIAWAAKKPIDSLLKVVKTAGGEDIVASPAGRGGRER